MRKILNPQMKFGEVDISAIEFDLRSRDEIPKLLMGLQYIYKTPEIKKQVYKVLNKIVPPDVDANNGRPGMHLWEVFVLGTIRLNCNFDYDKLQELGNHHDTLREMLGIAYWDKEKKYNLQTLKDNVRLLTEDVLEEINKIVVDSGHNLIKKNEKELKLMGRCDSFVVKTDVHYPTDSNLFYDALRKIIVLTSRICNEFDISGWRQWEFLVKKVKKILRKIEKLNDIIRRKKKNKDREERKRRKLYKLYLDFGIMIIERVEECIQQIRAIGKYSEEKLVLIENFIVHAKRQIDQIDKRVLKSEVIPHDEKVFSIFEEHTEWISKGKAGVPQELGLMVCILKDQYGFILKHRVMENQKDIDVAVPISKDAKKSYLNLMGCSYDCGFYSPDNKKNLFEVFEKAILPKKGKLSDIEKAYEGSEEFVRLRKKHSEVESAINALENHGLDRCPDHGIVGFKRYIALSVVARNIQIFGHILQQKELKKLLRREQKLKAA